MTHSASASQPVHDRSAIFTEVLAWLNRQEFPRRSNREQAPETLFAEYDRVRAHYASFRLDSLFQPLFDFRQRRIIGHEALLASVSASHSPESSSFAMIGNVLAPERVFTLASNEDITFIDRLARTLHTLNYLLQDARGLLHLNVHPHHLLAVSADHGRVFEGILRQCGLETTRIVLEIPEYAVAEKRRLAQAAQAWQEKGYHIAIDNAGREHLQVTRLLKLQPRYIKLDRQLLRSAAVDVRRFRQVAQMVAAANAAGVQVVGTGIEHDRQLDLLRRLDVSVAQGFLFGRPQPYCLQV